MGEIYLAEDTLLGRKVALKLLLDSYAAKDRNSAHRFQQEARAASALSHPNIAHIYEIGEADGAKFIAMEYVDGRRLDKIIDGHPLDSIQILDIAIQIADALDAAHSKGITHRDIKSANIVVSPRGLVKVLDFGLAKTMISLSQAGEDKAEAQVKTRPGVVLGTISYMSPEQAMGRDPDIRTDIFSLGVVLYEMTTGRLPFHGESVTETIDKIAHAQPDAMTRFNYDVSPELERIVRKALRKSRDERYQTARDLMVDLKNLKRELEFNSAVSSGAMAAPARLTEGDSREAPSTVETATYGDSRTGSLASLIKRHKLTAALAIVLLLGLLVVIPIALRKYFVRDRSGGSEAKAMKTKRLVTSLTGGKAGNTSISPDGRFVVYKDDEEDRRQGLWLRQVATGISKQIVEPEVVQYRGTTFSRDGNFVYYVVQGTKYPSGALFQVTVIGGAPKQLTVNISTPVTQSPDGRLAFAYERTLMVANADGTAARQLLSLHSSGAPNPAGPAWSPDGKTIAFGNRQNDRSPFADVFTIDVLSGEIKQVTNHKWGSVRRLVWLGDGQGLVILASDPEQEFSQIWEVSYPSGDVHRVTNDLNGHGHVSLGVTADSNTLVTQQEEDVSHVWIATNGDSGNARQLTSGEGKTEGRLGLAWSSGGRLIYSSNVNKGWDLWQIKADGTEQSPITTDAYRDEFPVFTPDGETVIFRSDRVDGTFHAWRIGWDGSGLRQLTSRQNAEDHAARISPDGNWVVYSSGNADQERIWRVSVDGGDPIQVTDYQSSSPDVSPDGKLIACSFLDQKAEPARWRLAIIPFDGGPPLKTIDLPSTADLTRSGIDRRAATYVRWLIDGRAVAYVDRQGGVSNIWSQPIDGGPPKQLTNFASGVIFNFELSPDGKQIACARGARNSDVILITDFR